MPSSVRLLRTRRGARPARRCGLPWSSGQPNPLRQRSCRELLHVPVEGRVAVHKVCSTFPAFEFQARPVIPVEDAVRVELEAIAWRDEHKPK
jgi:hypothetical protein